MKNLKKLQVREIELSKLDRALVGTVTQLGIILYCPVSYSTQKKYSVNVFLREQMSVSFESVICMTCIAHRLRGIIRVFKKVVSNDKTKTIW